MELDGTVNPAERSTEEEVTGLVRSSHARLIIIDLRTRTVTASTQELLLRLRQTVHAENATFCVVARHASARRELQRAGLSGLLLVSDTLIGTSTALHGGPLAHPRAAQDEEHPAPSSRARDRRCHR
jgi:anti-anti-sigma regulatory factor